MKNRRLPERVTISSTAGSRRARFPHSPVDGAQTGRGADNAGKGELRVGETERIARVVAAVRPVRDEQPCGADSHEDKRHEPEEEEEDVEDQDGPVVVSLGRARVHCDEPHRDDEGSKALDFEVSDVTGGQGLLG